MRCFLDLTEGDIFWTYLMDPDLGDLEKENLVTEKMIVAIRKENDLGFYKRKEIFNVTSITFSDPGCLEIIKFII